MFVILGPHADPLPGPARPGCSLLTRSSAPSSRACQPTCSARFAAGLDPGRRARRRFAMAVPGARDGFASTRTWSRCATRTPSRCRPGTTCSPPAPARPGTPIVHDAKTSETPRRDRCEQALAGAARRSRRRSAPWAATCPTDQEDKLMILLEDLAFFLDVPHARTRSRRGARRRRSRSRRLRDAARQHSPKVELWRTEATASPPAAGHAPASGLHTFLERIHRRERPRRPFLASRSSRACSGGFPRSSWSGCETALAARPEIELAGLPEHGCGSRMLAEDGSARLQIFPTADLSEDRRRWSPSWTALQDGGARGDRPCPSTWSSSARATGESLALRTAAPR